jgi:hypothetical protein
LNHTDTEIEMFGVCSVHIDSLSERFRKACTYKQEDEVIFTYGLTSDIKWLFRHTVGCLLKVLRMLDSITWLMVRNIFVDNVERD